MNNTIRRSDRLNPREPQEIQPVRGEEAPPPEVVTNADDSEEEGVDLPEQGATLTEEEQFQLVRRLFLDKRFTGSFSGKYILQSSKGA